MQNGSGDPALPVRPSQWALLFALADGFEKQTSFPNTAACELNWQAVLVTAVIMLSTLGPFTCASAVGGDHQSAGFLDDV